MAGTDWTEHRILLATQVSPFSTIAASTETGAVLPGALSSPFPAPRKSWQSNLRRQSQIILGLSMPFSPHSRYLKQETARRISVKYQKNLYFFPQTITTFDIILISSYIYFSTLGTRYRKYKHDLLNQRRHSIPLEKETKKLEEQDRNGEK